MIQCKRPSTEQISNQEYGERRLWTAVIVTAVEDWRTGTLRAKREAQTFLFDDDRDFTRVCSSAGLDPDCLRAKLMKVGCLVNMKACWN
jgi:hypothetical protein